MLALADRYLFIIIATGILLTSCSTGYTEKGDKVYYDGDVVDDTSSLHILNGDFAKDSAAVYYHRQKITGGDPDTFIALDEWYGKDRAHVYYCEANLRILLFSTDEVVQTEILENAVSENFKSAGFGYAQDHVHAFYQGKIFRVKDLVTLHGVAHNFAADDYTAYLKRKPIAGSLGKSFQLLDTASYGFARDAASVYYFNVTGDYEEIKRLPCNAATFQRLPGFFSKDDRTAFYKSFRLKDADAATFIVLDDYFSKDATHVYHDEKRIEGADAATFHIFQAKINDSSYHLKHARDRLSAYWESNRIAGADPDSFTAFENDYAKDNAHVYFQNNVLEGADPSTFKILDRYSGNADAADAQHEFHQGARLTDQ